VTGKLLSVGEDTAVLVRDEGDVVSVRKVDVQRLKIADAEAPAPAPSGDEEEPAETPAAADDESRPEPTDEETNENEETPDHRRLGLFTSHGVGYGRFRQPGDGGAVYALDIGAGYNWNERWGVYAVIGGVVGARLDDQRGHFGHFAVAFRRKWRYFAFLGGLGAGIAGVHGPGDALDRRVGLAVPIKLMGLIPLPKDLSLGIGLGYDLGLLPGQVVNGISLQVTVARW
jgi:hypothetical protein